jgi:hypothetical protein
MDEKTLIEQEEAKWQLKEFDAARFGTPVKAMCELRPKGGIGGMITPFTLLDVPFRPLLFVQR